ncbi:uncharacterized protein JCM15063_003357 [Sporobolomyces koalae]|uniref:uncharacterized protein n=1 Tax=Sporobolomyces koalae TaxID=500713 RepID=UPI00316C2CE0
MPPTNCDSNHARTALIAYPASQSYVVDSLREAFAQQLPQWTLATSRDELDLDQRPDLQWSDYDELDWDWAMDESRLLNSFAIRKALIRKSNLSHTIALYLSKNPDSPLRSAAPKTFHFNCSFADELDELLMDDLYEVEESFRDAEENGKDVKWWILKAALADKGNGIRLFSTRQALEDIFQEFEPESDDEDEEEEDDDEDAGSATPARAALFGADTRVDSTQMREWVIQEYIAEPLLLDPAPDSNENGTKFHLRVYVVAVGGLRVYVHHPYLALFAPVPYAAPEPAAATGDFDLSSHLTNTCLQTSVLGEDTPQVSVGCLQEMADKVILSGPSKGQKLSQDRIRDIERGVRETVSELFKAAIGAGSSFQVLPNAFEIFGVDFLVDSNSQVSLLEVNACPDFGQTGESLQSIISNLFQATIKVAVIPFFAATRGAEVDSKEEALDEAFTMLDIDGRGRGLKKVLEVEVSKAW